MSSCESLHESRVGRKARIERHGTQKNCSRPLALGSGPRVGVAYDLFGNGKTALRGGNGSASLAAIEKSTLVPEPNYVLSTSPDKYQVIWRVENIDLAQAEMLLRAIAREFDGDQAATDVARVLRVPGFMNKKYEQDFLVTAERHSDRIYHARDFNLRTEPPDSGYRRPRHPSSHTAKSEPRLISQSERDWAYVKSALANGADPEELIQQLAHSRAGDKSDPQYYARLTVTKALTDLRTHNSVLSSSSTLSSDDEREAQH